MTGPRVLRPHGSGRFVLFCDHASNYIPAELHALGLPASELARAHRLGHRRGRRHRGAVGNPGRPGDTLQRLAPGDRLQPPSQRFRSHTGNKRRHADPRQPASQRGSPSGPHRTLVSSVSRRGRIGAVGTRGERRAIHRSLHSFDDGFSGRPTKTLADRSLQPSRPQPGRPCARCPAPARRHCGGRQPTLRSGS